MDAILKANDCDAPRWLGNSFSNAVDRQIPPVNLHRFVSNRGTRLHDLLLCHVSRIRNAPTILWINVCTDIPYTFTCQRMALRLIWLRGKIIRQKINKLNFYKIFNIRLAELLKSSLPIFRHIIKLFTNDEKRRELTKVELLNFLLCSSILKL